MFRRLRAHVWAHVWSDCVLMFRRLRAMFRRLRAHVGGWGGMGGMVQGILKSTLCSLLKLFFKGEHPK